MIATLNNAWTAANAVVVSAVRRLLEARRRRIAQERKFYRDLDAYCRVHDLPPPIEDEWRMNR